MKAKKTFLSMTIILSVSYLPGVNACEKVTQYNFEDLMPNSHTIDINNSDTESYSFISDNCEEVKIISSEIKVGSYDSKNKVLLNPNNLIGMKK